MPIRLIRQNSDIPSVTNKDDARSIRYAYGGQDGFVQKAGAELSFTQSGNLFRINSGIVVLQGWESEIDSNGWSVTVDNVATKRYYSVYYEVNLATVTAEIKVVYDTAVYPEIDAGDDLAAVETGTARLLLYRFTSENGVIADVSKKVNPILFVTLVSSKPPITSITIAGGNLDDYGTIIDVGKRAISFDMRLPSSDVSSKDPKRITYLPQSARNSIAKVEFTYSQDGIIEYLPNTNGEFLAYAKVMLNDKKLNGDETLSEGWEIINGLDVIAKVTDIYGNIFNLKWSFSAFQIKRDV